jgi:DNA polymerase III subunit alpha
MYRPGPMELISSYCARKNGTERVPSVHPLVDDILAETYGIMCYQEQVMQVLNRLGKLPLNRALTLIKAISKKKRKTIAAERPNFSEGASENGIPQGEADRLFELIEKFAGYGFNKAHSTRYAIVAYQTAWFKANHPQEFMAALLTFECGDTDKVVQYLAEAARMDIKVAPPDINTGAADFAVDGDQVRFGLSAVKGIGGKAVQAIIDARQEAGQFKELYDFCKHVDPRSVNRSAVEALIKCGAFDALGASRAAMSAALDHAIELGQAAAADRRSGQMNFFAGLGGGEDDPPPRFPQVEPWSEAQLLAAEKETLGFYITSHPLIKYARELDSLSRPAEVSLARLDDVSTSTPVTLGCMIASVRNTVTRKKQERMAMLTVEDLTGKCDAVVFPRAYETYAEMLVPENMVFLMGTVDRRRERPNILVDEIIPIDQAIEQLTASVLLRLGPGHPDEELLQRLHDILVRHRGECPILIQLRPATHSDVRATVRTDRQWSVQPTRGLVDELVGLLGQENLVLMPKRANPNGGNGNGRRYGRRQGPQQGQLVKDPAAAVRA